jgi:hypothetical protein
MAEDRRRQRTDAQTEGLIHTGGAILGAFAGAALGTVAGAMVDPIGAVIGAVIGTALGGLAGAAMTAEQRGTPLNTTVAASEPPVEVQNAMTASIEEPQTRRAPGQSFPGAPSAGPVIEDRGGEPVNREIPTREVLDLEDEEEAEELAGAARQGSDNRPLSPPPPD